MRRWTLAVGLAVLAVGLERCSSGGGGGADAGAELDVGVAVDAGQDAGPGDAAAIDGSITPTACTPITNEGCDGGSCFTLSIDQMGNIQYGCGKPNSGGDYAPCVNSLNCKDGFSCLQLGDDTSRSCHQYCTASSGCPGATTQLPEACITYTGSATVGYCVRVTACNIFLQDCPGTAQGCYPVSGGYGCVQPGTRADGAACSFDNQCLPGSACVNPASAADAGGVSPSHICAKVCDTSLADGGVEDGGDAGAGLCPAGVSCIELVNPAKPYGFCPP